MIRALEEANGVFSQTFSEIASDANRRRPSTPGRVGPSGADQATLDRLRAERDALQVISQLMDAEVVFPINFAETLTVPV